MPPSHTTPHQLKLPERKQKVWDLRLQGATYIQIAKETGVPIRTVQRWVAQDLERLNDQTSDMVSVMRRIQAMRLDQLVRNAWVGVEQGDSKAIAVVVKIEERRAKLFGLDAPVITLVGDLTNKDQQQLQLIAERLGLPLTIDVTGVAAYTMPEAPALPEDVT